MGSTNVLVVGAGVSGLSSAILLHDAGFRVSIWAKDLTSDTTSNIAAAFWYPYLCNPREKAITWSKATYQYLEKNTLSHEASGTKYITFIEYLTQKSPDPWWRAAVDVFERSPQSELPKGYVDGYKTKAIVMDTSRYLPWLLKQIESRGIVIEQKVLSNFDDALSSYDIVVNCTGLGSKELCHDDRLFPVRGQVVRVESNGFDKVVSDENEDNLAYIIPRFNDVIIGGTAQENDWNLQVDPADTVKILEKAKLIAPEFENVKIIEEKVGLRPARDEIRLELETINGKLLIHNYGHGGAGFTLSWGCATEVVSLAINAAKV
jgi:D-amino-acid oxidase